MRQAHPFATRIRRIQPPHPQQRASGSRAKHRDRDPLADCEITKKKGPSVQARGRVRTDGAFASLGGIRYRCVFYIDPKNTVRAMIYYPMNVGRNFDEILRVIDALQTADQHGISCPADWTPGQEVIVPAPATTEAAKTRMETRDFAVVDWYLAKKKL